MEFERPVAIDNGMTGIVAAAITNDQPRPLGKHVYDMPLAFVAPLGANYCDDRHLRAPFCSATRKL